MSTSSQNPSPDFGEPWKCETGDFEIYSKSEHNATAYAESARIRDRIIKCVNACQGMADPAAEIEAMRTEREEMRKALETFWEALPERLRQEEENKAMREVIAEAWQPIDTIPKDGTAVLVWAQSMHRPDIAWHEESGMTMRCYTHWMPLPKSPSALTKLQPFLP